MNLRLLEILETVAREGSFTRAADCLHLTQSAVSHAVAELERQAGTALFDRLPRGVRLLPCGAMLLDEARGILSSCRALERRMENWETQVPIRLVSCITIASFWLPGVLRQLQAQAPALRVQVQVASAANALEVLRNGSADLALIEGGAPREAHYTCLPFASYQLWAACAPDFPLPEERLTPQVLCRLPLLLREPGSAIRDTLDSALHLVGQSATPAWESVNSGALIEAASAGLGISILPDLLLRTPISQGRLRRLSLEGLHMENGMLAVYHRDKYLTQNLRQFLRCIPSYSEPAEAETSRDKKPPASAP